MYPSTAVTPPNPELAALPNLFLLDIQNRAIVDGKAPRGGYNGAILFLAIVLPVLALLAILWNGGPWLDYVQLKLTGRTTPAIAALPAIETRCLLVFCSDSYVLNYTFVVDERMYEGSAEIDPVSLPELFGDSAIRIVYLPDNPAVSQLRGSGIEPTMIPRGILTVGLFIGAVAALAAGILHVRTARDPRNRGQLLRGEITGWEAHETGAGKAQVQVELRYTFQTPRGNRVEQVQMMKMSAGKYHSMYFPKAGTPIAVLYVDDQQHEVL